MKRNPPIPTNPQPMEQVTIQMPDSRKAAWALVSCVVTVVVIVLFA